MPRECRERFPCHRLQRKPLVSDPVMHHGTCVTHVPCYMSRSLTRGGRENVPGIPGACATRNFTYLLRGPWWINRPSTALPFNCHSLIWMGPGICHRSQAGALAYNCPRPSAGTLRTFSLAIKYFEFVFLDPTTFFKIIDTAPPKAVAHWTLNMLNCFEDYKRYNHILNHIFDLVWPK